MLKQGASDSVTHQALDGLSRWFGALSQYPKTTLRRPAGDVTLPLHVVTEQIHNALGEPMQIRTLYTDVEINGENERFIFDTGCSHGSFVSQEFADRHGIRIIYDSILVSGAAASAYARTGILDSMCIGPVTVYNPTFIISPPNEAVDTLMKVHAVLGTDFMNLAGEVRLYPQQGKIVLPAEQTPLPACGRNLSLDTSSGQYALSVSCDTEPVTMIFDTGSTSSSMGRPWFESHRAQVEATGTYKEMGVGGFGGTIRGHGYQMPSLRFGVGAHTTTLSDIRVYSDIDVQNDRYDGCLGADFILSLDKVVINFSRMFMIGE